MNKLAAKKLVDSGKLTWGQLRESLSVRRAAGGLDKPSRLNKGITVEKALHILCGALSHRDDDTFVVPYRYNASKGRETRTSEALTATNIVRECM